MKFTFNKFDLQLFGGKGSSTTVVPSNVPDPTEEEKQMQKLQLDYARPTAATALKLQDMGQNMLFNNPGVTPVNYTNLGNKGYQQSLDIQGKSNDLVSGKLPSAYTENRDKTLQNYAQNSLGSLLNQASMKGRINSSTTEAGIKGLSDSIAEQANKGFQQDLATQSNLLEQNRGLVTMPMEILNAAQNASIDIPGKILALGTGQQAPSTDAWKTMSNQRYTMASPQQTIVEQGNQGGVLGSVLGGLATGWACFIAGTLIDTPSGQVPIEDIQVGDEVIGVDGVTVVTKVYTPVKRDIVEVIAENGKLDTTESQRLLLNDKLVEITQIPGTEYITENNGRILSITFTARNEYVYDFDVEGQNLFYANGFLVEGMDENWELL